MRVLFVLIWAPITTVCRSFPIMQQQMARCPLSLLKVKCHCDEAWTLVLNQVCTRGALYYLWDAILGSNRKENVIYSVLSSSQENAQILLITFKPRYTKLYDRHGNILYNFTCNVKGYYQIINVQNNCNNTQIKITSQKIIVVMSNF